MHDQRAVVGVDLGTSGVKVLVTSLDGAVLGRGRAEYPVLVPARGRAESDPRDWWRATARAVRQAVGQAREAEIVGVAVAGQMHGLVLAADGDAAAPTPRVTRCGRRSCGSTSGPPSRPAATRSCRPR